MASEVITLKNSTKNILIHEEDRALPIVSMQLIFEASGSIADGKKAGLAKVVSRVLGEGTQQEGSAKFAEALESKAIHLSASNGTETFVFELSALKSEFKEGVAAFRRLLQDPNFTEATVEKVKTKLIGSLTQKQSDFDYVASQALKALLFEGTELEHPSSGSVESVKSITLQDVRDFYKEHMVGAKAITVIGGDVTQQEASDYAMELIGVLPTGKKATLPQIEVRKNPKEEIVTKDTKQAYVYFGSPLDLKVDDEDTYKARVAMYILGTGGFGSRLMEEIRVKRGLAYSAYARTSLNKSHNYVTGYLQTKIETGSEALGVVKEEFARFVKDGVTQEELDGAKAFLLGSEPLRTETLSQRLSRTFMSYYKGLPLDSNEKELEAIQALNLSDLNTFIKDHKEILDLSVVTVTK